MSIITGPVDRTRRSAPACVYHSTLYVACYAIAYHQQSGYAAPSVRACARTHAGLSRKHSARTCFKCLIAPASTRRADMRDNYLPINMMWRVFRVCVRRV